MWESVKNSTVIGLVAYRLEVGECLDMKGRKEESELKDKRVTVQVTANEKAKLKEIAKRKGVSISDLIRMKCIYEAYENMFGGMV